MKVKLNLQIVDYLKTSNQLFNKIKTLFSNLKDLGSLVDIFQMIESISSNEIENIHTTVDEAYDSLLINEKNNLSPYVRYRETLKQAHKRMIASEIIRPKDILWINENIRGINSGFRKTPVTIKDGNGKVVHSPPSADKIPELISSLTKLINEDWNQNTTVKSLLINHEFERIHPFVDGNGRTGRILFALLLNKFDILDVPASVFSYSLLKEKENYYKALKQADNGNINSYLATMLKILISSLKVTIDFAEEYNKKLQEIINFDEIQSNKTFRDVVVWSFAGVKVSNKYLISKTKQNNKTIKKYIDKLVDLNVIEIEIKGRHRPYKNLILENLVKKYFNNI